MGPRIAKKIMPEYVLQYKLIDRKRAQAQKLIDFNKRFALRIEKLKESNASKERIEKELSKYGIEFQKLKDRINYKN